jgi:hypothetical protein
MQYDKQQRGISLIQVAIVMASLAAIAMAALMSMRQERNLFTEALGRLSGKPAAAPVAAASNPTSAPTSGPAAAKPAAPAGVLRKCIINGKTVLSDVDCDDKNPTSKVVQVHETRGIESPRVPQPDPAASTPQSAQDKMIEKATR